MTPSETCLITWLGHATVLIERDGVRVLTDPVLRRRVGPLIRIAPPVALPPEIDVVVLSHMHADHLDLPTLRRLGSPQIIAPAGCGPWLARRGFSDVDELLPGMETSVGSLRIRATPAVHDDRRSPMGARATPVGYVLGTRGAVYFAGDTDLFDEMRDVHVHGALLPVSGWGPRVPAGHLDPARAAQAAAMIAPEVAIPIHWGTYGLPWASRPADLAEPARRFAELVRGEAPGVDVRLLRPGESLDISDGNV